MTTYIPRIVTSLSDEIEAWGFEVGDVMWIGLGAKLPNDEWVVTVYGGENEEFLSRSDMLRPHVMAVADLRPVEGRDTVIAWHRDRNEKEEKRLQEECNNLRRLADNAREVGRLDAWRDANREYVEASGGIAWQAWQLVEPEWHGSLPDKWCACAR